MNAIQIIVSALTAFIIASGGAMFLVFIQTKGVMPDKTVWAGAIILGLITAAKDTRSLLKLPPVTPATGNTDQIIKPPTP